MKPIPSILYVAGKSGGHIIPALTLAEQEHTRHNSSIFFIAHYNRLDIDLVSPHDWIAQKAFISIPTIERGAIRRYPWYVLQLLYALLRSVYILLRWRPNQIVSTGGLIAIPVCMAGKLLGIPCIVYELNSEVGAAVEWLQGYATEVRCCSRQALIALDKNSHGVIVPYPLRRAVITAQQAIRPEIARKHLGLDEHTITICIVGGSQGSQGLNRLMMEWIRNSQCEKQRVQIIHQTGRAHVDGVEHFYQEHGIRAVVCAYHTALELCYQAADIIITRAGAGALNEIALFTKITLIVPLITRGTAHQQKNAQEFVTQYPHWYMVDQENSSGFINILSDRIDALKSGSTRNQNLERRAALLINSKLPTSNTIDTDRH